MNGEIDQMQIFATVGLSVFNALYSKPKTDFFPILIHRTSGISSELLDVDYCFAC